MADESGKPKNKMIIWVVVGVGVIIAEVLLSYVIVTKFLMPSTLPSENKKVVNNAGNPAAAKPIKKREKKPEKKQNKNSDSSDFSQIQGIYTLGDFVVNPANSDGKHFFVFTAVFAFEDKTYADLIKKREPMLKDKIITVLGKRSFEWFGINQNREIIRKEMVKLGEDVLQCSSGVQVYFTKYVLQ